MPEIDQIKKVLVKHEKRISDLEKLFKSDANRVPTNEEESVSELIGSGFFDEAKRYKDIIRQLKTLAIFSKKVAYKKILANLVKDKHLNRKMISHQWWYIKYDQ